MTTTLVFAIAEPPGFEQVMLYDVSVVRGKVDVVPEVESFWPLPPKPVPTQ